MLKLIVVDDEKIIREGIRDCINWSNYGIRLIGEARNGLDALELAKREKPDIVLTDVRMPLMTGIELAAELKRIYGEIKIIFISGYSDLDYIKSAFKHDVIDYILKPVDIDELEKAIIKVVGMCELERKRKEFNMQLEQKLLQSMPFLREKFMKLLVNGEVTDRQKIIERLKFLGIDIPENGRYTVFIISIDNFEEKFGSTSQRDRQLLEFSIVNIAQEVIDTYTKGYVFEWKEDEFVCVLSIPSDDELVEECIDQVSSGIHKSLNQYLQLNNTLSIGLWTDSLESLYLSYKYAMNAMKRKFLLGNNRIIYVDVPCDENDCRHGFDRAFFERFSDAVYAFDAEKACKIIRLMFREIRRMKLSNQRRIKSWCLHMTSIISGAAADKDAAGEEASVDILNMSEEILKKKTLDEMEEFLLRSVEKVCEEASKKLQNETVSLVDRINSIIEKKYAEDLTINSIAKEVYLTPAYICMLYKQETGKTINEYLTSVRIEKAKGLLMQGGYKIHEVALKVGYGDQKYFSKLFKRYTGMNPSDYSEYR